MSSQCRLLKSSQLIIRGACRSKTITKMTSSVSLRVRQSPYMRSQRNNSLLRATTTRTCSESFNRRQTISNLLSNKKTSSAVSSKTTLMSHSRPNRKNRIILAAICSVNRFRSRSRSQTTCSTCRRALEASPLCLRRPLAPQTSRKICLICSDEQFLLYS
jgi:hypothetical protein